MMKGWLKWNKLFMRILASCLLGLWGVSSFAGDRYLESIEFERSLEDTIGILQAYPHLITLGLLTYQTILDEGDEEQPNDPEGIRIPLLILAPQQDFEFTLSTAHAENGVDPILDEGDEEQVNDPEGVATPIMVLVTRLPTNGLDPNPLESLLDEGVQGQLDGFEGIIQSPVVTYAAFDVPFRVDGHPVFDPILDEGDEEQVNDPEGLTPPLLIFTTLSIPKNRLDLVSDILEGINR